MLSLNFNIRVHVSRLHVGRPGRQAGSNHSGKTLDNVEGRRHSELMQKLDHGLGTVGLMALAIVLTFVISAGLPLITTAEPVKVSDWLGFAGNIVGAGGTLMAAFIAWSAVQQQISEQRRAVESQRRDEADVRLNMLTSAIVRARSEYAMISVRKDAERIAQYEEFEAFRTSNEVLLTIIDPVVGRDNEAIGFLFNAMHHHGGALIGKYDEKKGRIYADLIPDLYRQIVNSLDQRRDEMRHNDVDHLRTLKLVDVDRYRKRLRTAFDKLHQ
jgi:hypothetical protein